MKLSIRAAAAHLARLRLILASLRDALRPLPLGQPHALRAVPIRADRLPTRPRGRSRFPYR